MKTITEIEIWKPIPEYEDYYLVSNLGRVLSLGRKGISRNNKPYSYKSKIMRGRLNRHGYVKIGLRNSQGIQKTFTVHTLVAKTFIGPRLPSLVVNHKNEIKTDNTLYNLEYVSHKYNTNYGTGPARRLRNNTNRISVGSFRGDKLVKSYYSMSSTKLDGFSHSSIRKAIKSNTIYKDLTWKILSTYKSEGLVDVEDVN